MHRLTGCLLGLLLALATYIVPAARGAEAWRPEGSWIVSDRVAVELFDCSARLCGRIVWLRNPALRTAAMCGRTIVWNLRRSGTTEWSDGLFFDPENGSTYNLSARLENDDLLSARIYAGVSLFGKTEMLRRIRPKSLAGWC
jgi:uncharacterized protein (DUF2147 family)